MTLDITTGHESLSAAERNGLYDKVVTPHYNIIAQAVRRQTFPGEDADDNLQDVLIVLLRNAPKIAALPLEHQLPWMLRTVRNKLTSIHRHTRYVNDALRYDDDALCYDDDNDNDALRYDNDDDALCYDNDALRCDNAAAPLTIDRDDYPRTYDALMRLSPLQRRALLLESEGWSPADIMAELRLPASTVYPMLSRARHAVARALEMQRGLKTCIGNSTHN